MAENRAGMLIDGTMVVGAETRRGRGRGQRNGVYGLVAAALVAVVIGGATLHDRGGSHPAAVAIPRAATGAETLFLERNTTDLPVAVAAEVGPINIAEQSLLAKSATRLPNAAVEKASSPVASSRWRFLEVNTMMLPAEASVNRVCHFTYDDAYMCSIFRTDGTWLRDEALDNGAWMVTSQAVPDYAVSGQATDALFADTAPQQVIPAAGPSSPYAEDMTPLPGHRR